LSTAQSVFMLYGRSQEVWQQLALPIESGTVRCYSSVIVSDTMRWSAAVFNDNIKHLKPRLLCE